MTCEPIQGLSVKFTKHYHELEAYIDQYDIVLICAKDIKKSEIKDVMRKQRQQLKVWDVRIRDKFYVVADVAKEHMTEVLAEIQTWHDYNNYDQSYREEPLRSQVLAIPDTDEGWKQLRAIGEERMRRMDECLDKRRYVYSDFAEGEYSDYARLLYGPFWFIVTKYR
jgi:hypothetical protein